MTAFNSFTLSFVRKFSLRIYYDTFDFTGRNEVLLKGSLDIINDDVLCHLYSLPNTVTQSVKLLLTACVAWKVRLEMNLIMELPGKQQTE